MDIVPSNQHRVPGQYEDDQDWQLCELLPYTLLLDPRERSIQHAEL